MPRRNQSPSWRQASRPRSRDVLSRRRRSPPLTRWPLLNLETRSQRPSRSRSRRSVRRLPLASWFRMSCHPRSRRHPRRLRPSLSRRTRPSRRSWRERLRAPTTWRPRPRNACLSRARHRRRCLSRARHRRRCLSRARHHRLGIPLCPPRPYRRHPLLQAPAPRPRPIPLLPGLWGVPRPHLRRPRRRYRRHLLSRRSRRLVWRPASRSGRPLARRVPSISPTRRRPRRPRRSRERRRARSQACRLPIRRPGCATRRSPRRPRPGRDRRLHRHLRPRRAHRRLHRHLRPRRAHRRLHRHLRPRRAHRRLHRHLRPRRAHRHLRPRRARHSLPPPRVRRLSPPGARHRRNRPEHNRRPGGSLPDSAPAAVCRFRPRLASAAAAVARRSDGAADGLEPSYSVP
jgi:hypothetical protein